MLLATLWQRGAWSPSPWTMTNAEASSDSIDLKSAVLDSLLALPVPDPSSVTDTAAQTLYGQLFGALGGSVDVEARSADACAGVVLAVKKMDVALWHLARGATIGVLHAVVGRHLDPGPVLSACVAGMMEETDGFGADYGAVAQGAVEGAIIGSQELGLDPSDLGTQVATAALEKAISMGDVAREKIQHLVNRRTMGYTISIPSSLLS